MQKEDRDLIKELFSSQEILRFSNILSKNNHIKKGHFAYLYRETLSFLPYEYFSKDKKYDVILLLFPSSFLSLKEMVNLHKNLTKKGNLIFLDFMKRSKKTKARKLLYFNKNTYKIKNYLVIENLREYLKDLRYSVKKKMIVDFLWILKISNEHKIHEPLKDDFTFNKYPFSITMRNFIFDKITEICNELSLNNYVIAYDGNKLGNIHTVDFYNDYSKISNKQIIVAPFLYNRIESTGMAKKIINNWTKNDNHLIIPVIKRNFLNKHFNFKFMKFKDSSLLFFESYQKIDFTFFYIERLTKNSRVFEYNMLRFISPTKISLTFKKVKSKDKIFNIYKL